MQVVRAGQWKWRCVEIGKVATPDSHISQGYSVPPIFCRTRALATTNNWLNLLQENLTYTPAYTGHTQQAVSAAQHLRPVTVPCPAVLRLIFVPSCSQHSWLLSPQAVFSSESLSIHHAPNSTPISPSSTYSLEQFYCYVTEMSLNFKALKYIYVIKNTFFSW